MTQTTRLRLEEVSARYRRCVMTIRRWIEDEKLGFPKPIKLRNRLYFSIDELHAFEDQFPDRFGAHD